MSATWLASSTPSPDDRPDVDGVPRCIVFDLDGTLTGSKVPIERPMAETLLELVRRLNVGIVTGGRYRLIKVQVLPYLDELGWSDDDRRRLHLLPACGTQRRRWDGRTWHQEFREDLDPIDRECVPDVLTDAAKELGLFESRHWGAYIDDRGGQITYSVFGQQAPLEVKQAWDPDGTKKERIRLLAAERLPHLSVVSGASSSVDVTRPGRDKAFGVERLAAALGVRLEQLVFVGDRLQDGGNDASLRRLPVALVSVRRPSDTLTWAREVVDRLDESRVGEAGRPRGSMSGQRTPNGGSARSRERTATR
jgi:phosphomannomutase